jgi:hypothetical protein
MVRQKYQLGSLSNWVRTHALAATGLLGAWRSHLRLVDRSLGSSVDHEDHRLYVGGNIKDLSHPYLLWEVRP